MGSYIENRGYYLAVPLWIAEYTLGFVRNFGSHSMLERVTFENIVAVFVLIFVWGFFLVISTLFGGQFVVMLQAWLLKRIIPKQLVRNIVRLMIKYPQRSKKYDSACSFLNAQNSYKVLACEYRKIYPDVQSVNYNIEVYSQLKIVELLDKVKKYNAIENEIIKKENIRQSQDYWFKLDPYEFENEVALWYERKGYKCQVTKKSGDGGVDVIVTKGKTKAYVQCKRYTTSKVDRPTLNQLYGVVCAEEADYGIVVCLLGVTDEAKEFARKVGIKIVTISDLCPAEDLFHQKNLKKLYNNEVVKVSDYWCKIGNIQIQSNIYMTDNDLLQFTSKWKKTDMYHPVHYCGLTFCFYCSLEDANDFNEWLCKDITPHAVQNITPNRNYHSYKRKRKWYR